MSSINDHVYAGQLMFAGWYSPNSGVSFHIYAISYRDTEGKVIAVCGYEKDYSPHMPWIFHTNPASNVRCEVCDRLGTVISLGE